MQPGSMRLQERYTGEHVEFGGVHHLVGCG